MGKSKYVFGDAYYSKVLVIKSYYHYRAKAIRWWCETFKAIRPPIRSDRRALVKAKQVTNWDLSTMNLFERRDNE